MKKIIAILLTGTALVGCNGSEISSVKNGTMSGYKSLTVGEAFDNWQVCDKSQSKWELITASNGTKVVEFECQVKDLNKIVAALDDKIEYQRNQSLEYNKDSNTQETIERINKKAQNFKTSIALTKIVYTFQWTINKDNSFELSYDGIEYFWQDGTNHTEKHLQDILDIVYQDQNALLDTASSGRGYALANMLDTFYLNAH